MILASILAHAAALNAAAPATHVAMQSLSASAAENHIFQLARTIDSVAKQRFTRTSRAGMEADYRTYTNMNACRVGLTTRQIVTGRRGVRESEREGRFEAKSITSLDTGTSGVFGSAYLAIFVGPQPDGKSAVTVKETPYDSATAQVSQDNQIDLYFPSIGQAEEVKNLLRELSQACAKL